MSEFHTRNSNINFDRLIYFKAKNVNQYLENAGTHSNESLCSILMTIPYFPMFVTKIVHSVLWVTRHACESKLTPNLNALALHDINRVFVMLLRAPQQTNYQYLCSINRVDFSILG